MTLILTILDGFGIRADTAYNGVALANMPYYRSLLAQYPHSELQASSLEVGLPSGQMGNSEVGHTAIGAGRLIRQSLPKIDYAIQKNTLASQPNLVAFMDKLNHSKGVCHLMGLLSDGGVHSHQQHLFALARILAEHQIPVRIHAFLDGRDVAKESAKQYLQDLATAIQDLPNTKLASLGGRYYGMDRDNNWSRVALAYHAIVHAEPKTQLTPIETIEQSYTAQISDEFVVPLAFADYEGMHDQDGVIMCNFRADRAREIVTTLANPNFQEFDTRQRPQLAAVLGMTEYSAEISRYVPAIFPPEELHNTLGEVIAQQQLQQLRIAETEKYAHVTFFFNGGREEVFPGEDRILVPSPKVASYDLQPEMSAPEVTTKVVEAIQSQQYALIVLNFANPDMVGHTGNLEAVKSALSTLDGSLQQIHSAIQQTHGIMLITADHGNSELMWDTVHNQPHTAHTTNPVPFILLNEQDQPQYRLKNGALPDIAPTILALLHIPQPTEMTGQSLLIQS